jgi:signal-transduction protein with cAMP-binding, CBS, and nucleotidyltransferase domain
MKKKSLQYLPVYQEETFIGILSFQDILAWLTKEKIVDVSDVTV